MRCGWALVCVFLLSCSANEAGDSGSFENASAVEDLSIENANENVSLDLNAVDNSQDSANVSNATDALPGDIIQPGRGAFVDTGAMEVGRWYTAEFIVAPTEAALAEEGGDLPLVRSQPVFTSPYMRVRLVPDRNFEFEPRTPELQPTGLDRSASWQWNVKPLNKGDHWLTAKVEVLARKPDGTLTSIDDYTRRVSVKVEVGTWESFLTALRNASSLGEVFEALFRSWERALLALAALLTAGFVVLRVVRSRGHNDAGKA